MTLICGHTGITAGCENCGLCRIHGCEGYKIYKQKHKNDKQRSNNLYNLIKLKQRTIFKLYNDRHHVS